MDYRKFLSQPSQSLIYITVLIFNKFLCRRYHNTYWKWYYISVLKIAVLKLTFINWFVRMWSIAVAFLLVTLVGMFMVGIIPFSYSKFKKLCTLLYLSWSRILKLKSPAIWKGFKLLFAFFKISFKNLSNGSITPFRGLYKTFIKVYRSL